MKSERKFRLKSLIKENSVYITSYVIHINKHKQIRNSFQKSTTTNEKKMKNKNNRKCSNLKGTTIFSQMI